MAFLLFYNCDPFYYVFFLLRISVLLILVRSRLPWRSSSGHFILLKLLSCFPLWLVFLCYVLWLPSCDNLFSCKVSLVFFICILWYHWSVILLLNVRDQPIWQTSDELPRTSRTIAKNYSLPTPPTQYTHPGGKENGLGEIRKKSTMLLIKLHALLKCTAKIT